MAFMRERLAAEVMHFKEKSLKPRVRSQNTGELDLTLLWWSLKPLQVLFSPWFVFLHLQILMTPVLQSILQFSSLVGSTGNCNIELSFQLFLLDSGCWIRKSKSRWTDWPREGRQKDCGVWDSQGCSLDARGNFMMQILSDSLRPWGLGPQPGVVVEEGRRKPWEKRGS